MKKVLIYSGILGVLFVGCGSTTVGTISSSEGSSVNEGQNTTSVQGGSTGSATLALHEYLYPQSSQDIQSLTYKNHQFYAQETLRYTVTESEVRMQSLQNQSGEIRYAKTADEQVTVTLQAVGGSANFSLKDRVAIGDSVTLHQSECQLKALYSTLNFVGTVYSNVLKIACPKSNGYYQKGKGLVLEDIIDTSLENKAILPRNAYIDKKIKTIGSYPTLALSLGAFNLQSAIEAQVDQLWLAPYNLNGQGMRVGLVDGGAVLTSHVEFGNRVQTFDANSKLLSNLSKANTDLHATHVAGTIVAEGGHDGRAHGFANQAQLFTYSYKDRVFFADSIKKLYDKHAVLISNHSYGYDGADSLGIYDEASRELDIAISSNPYLIAVMAAGNDGEKYKTESDFSRWGIIKGATNAKNVITVAAVHGSSDRISSYSSAGPIRSGGRLKPDIAAEGENVFSTGNNDDTAYKTLRGTSMATPAVTGASVLLAQRYKQMFSANIRLDTLKALLFNTAVDIEAPGPDYKSGFGKLDALKAVQVMETMQEPSSSLVTLDSLYEGDTISYRFSPSFTQEFKVTLAWVDPANVSAVSAEEGLVNDIDMYLVDESSHEIIYPYTLQENNPSSYAKHNRENHVDPQEQIVRKIRAGRMYTLHIKGRKIKPNGQAYTLVASRVLDTVQKNIAVRPLLTHIHKIYESTK